VSTIHHLSARGLSKSYRHKKVVSDIDVDVFSGECIGLLGPNGAGKTTCFYMLCGLIGADAGEVSLNDQKITRQPMHIRARSGIGYLPQEASIFRKLTVRENLLAIFETLKLPDIQIEEEMEKLLIELGIEDVQHQKAYTLSGGQRRRTEIARALVTRPRFLLLDEPFAGVDPIAVEDIQTIIAELRNKNIGILITDHNVRDTLSICDRAYLMNEGNIIVQGTSEEIIAHPDARRLYLGESFSM
jgi:lipopolysaccharide export system ATP-binding protein